MLCFSNATKDQTVKAIYTFYDYEEIYAAKEILYQKYDIGIFPPRKTSSNRSESEAHTIDILIVIKDIDADGSDTNFVARNLKRIPRWDPNEIDSMAIVEKLKILEGRVTSAECVVSENKAKLIDMGDKMRKIDRRVNANEQALVARKCPHPSYSSAVISGNQPNHKPVPVRPKQPVNQPKLVVKLPEQTGPRPSPTVLPDQQPNPEVTRKMPNPIQPAEQSFQFQRDERRRQYQQSRRQQRVVQGTAGSNKGSFIGGPPPRRDFFLYRVNKNASVEDIAGHMREKEIEPINIGKLSKDEATFCSYKIVVSADFIEKMMAAETWPVGVRTCIRRFRPRNTTTYHDSNG